jgi:translation initiation factor IF-2
MTDRARSKEPAVKSENGAAAPIAAKLETAAVPAPPKVAAQESKNQAVEPIRRVSAPLGPAAAAAARAAERAREVSAPGERSSGQAASATRSVSDVRGLQRAKPAASDPARPAPKTGIDVWEGRPGVPMPQAPRSSGVPRRVQYDAKGGGSIGSQAPRRGPQQSNSPQGNNSRGRGGSSSGARRGGVNQFSSRRPGTSSIVTQERAAHKKVVRIEGDVSLQNLAAKMGVKAGEVLMKLMSLGMSGIHINSTLDSDTAKLVSEEFGWTVEDVAVSEDAAIAAAQGGDAEDVDEEREPRPPVVTVMGHVDHGKTSLLDKIRKSTVAQGEAGGITQHIGAYSVKTRKGRVTFLDTPGHAAFTQMRARGAKVTDVVVLVVAADDGVMPQTREAVSHAKDAKCPIVVAVNKIDKPDAQPERVRRELSELGLVPEEWGGDTLFCEVSAHSGQGIDELLDAILLQAEVLDLRANPKRHARGTVIEAKLDRGQGPVATVLVMEGTLRKGDGVLVGNSWGKVRAMLDEHGRNVPSAGPSTPVAVIGLSEVPSAGDIVDAVSDAKKAQQIAEQRRDKLAEKSRGASSKVSLEELARRMSQSDQKELKLIIKGDVQGSVEALSDALSKLTTEKVRVTVVHSGVGAVTEGDVNLAVAAKAIIISFNARPAGKAAALAQKEEIEIRQYSVIYDAIDDVLATMQGLLAPKLVEEAIGEAEVRKIFKVSKAGVVAGCMVTNGVVRRNSFVRLRRGKDIIWEGKLESLRRFKDDAKEVREGFDCGISFAGFSDVQEGDIVNAFEMKEVRATL